LFCRLRNSDINVGTQTHWLIMVALWNRTGHYIFIVWFLSILYLLDLIYLFFSCLISAVAEWVSTIRHMMWS